MRLPRIALTMGDPAGIGPEIAVRLARAVSAGKTSPAEVAIYGAPDVIEEAVRRFAPGSEPWIVPCSDLKFSQIIPGKLDARCGLTALAMNFVKAHNGSWNHADWLNFLREIEEKGYFPIDTDRVGLILEDKKVIFFSK